MPPPDTTTNSDDEFDSVPPPDDDEWAAMSNANLHSNVKDEPQDDLPIPQKKPAYFIDGKPVWGLSSSPQPEEEPEQEVEEEEGRKEGQEKGKGKAVEKHVSLCPCLAHLPPISLPRPVQLLIQLLYLACIYTRRSLSLLPRRRRPPPRSRCRSDRRRPPESKSASDCSRRILRM